MLAAIAVLKEPLQRDTANVPGFVGMAPVTSPKYREFRNDNRGKKGI